ncbi:MAG: NAD(P)/FAD-dependent oxidoreductase [Candidatus Dojkabacteria bacterium]|jgi:thioredoxin reductase (NADPH)
MSDTKIYDVAIIGSGPAGYTAGIYASRYKLSNIIIGGISGGTMTEAHKICNYPGYTEISGMELSMKFLEHAKESGSEILSDTLLDVTKDKDVFKIKTKTKEEILSKTIIVATGTDRNKLMIPREDEFLGKGLSYCTTCDGMFYKGKTVGVIGGSSAATMAAVMLSGIAKEVYIIYRGTELRGEPAWIDQVKQKENIKVLLTTLITELDGENKLERVKLSKEYEGSEYLNLNGIFVEIGAAPNNLMAEKLGLETDEKMYIKVDNAQETSLEGVWAAGDCTTNSNYFHQIVCATSEGAVAANSVYTYLKEK